MPNIRDQRIGRSDTAPILSSRSHRTDNSQARRLRTELGYKASGNCSAGPGRKTGPVAVIRAVTASSATLRVGQRSKIRDGSLEITHHLFQLSNLLLEVAYRLRHRQPVDRQASCDFDIPFEAASGSALSKDAGALVREMHANNSGLPRAVCQPFDPVSALFSVTPDAGGSRRRLSLCLAVDAYPASAPACGPDG